MGKVSESIWSDGRTVIPMAEVSHIDKYGDTHGAKNRIVVIFKHSKTNPDLQQLEPCVYLDENSKSTQFLKDWCYYRHELEFETLSDPSLPEN